MSETLPAPRILLVEDDPSLSRALADKFRRERYLVDEARSGVEGLVHARLDHPDVILLDIAMAEMDGVTMLEKLRRADRWGKRVPVIFLTNLPPDPEIMERIKRERPALYLVKSDHLLSEIVEKVKDCLGGAPGQS